MSDPTDADILKKTILIQHIGALNDMLFTSRSSSGEMVQGLRELYHPEGCICPDMLDTVGSITTNTSLKLCLKYFTDYSKCVKGDFLAVIL